MITSTALKQVANFKYLGSVPNRWSARDIRGRGLVEQVERS